MDGEQQYCGYSDPTTNHHHNHHHHHHHRNSHSATSSWSSEDHPPPPPPYPHRNFDTPHSVGFSGDGHYDHRPHYNHHRYNNRYHQNFNSGQNDSDIGHTSSLSGFKRHFSHSSYGPYPDYIDGGNCVKLYVGGIPRTSTVEEIHSLFEQHGNIVEVILIKDKTTGQQQEYCFVKYEMLEEADRAIGALNNQYAFPGMVPIKVRYAAKERERHWGFGAHEHKLYVGCLNKQASIREIEEEIEEIFSAYGFVKDVFIARDEFDQSRGFGFITFSQREMAVAAMKALSGTYFMRGCDQALIVRFADPKKPRMGESRDNCKFAGSDIGSQFQEPVLRPAPCLNDPMVGQMLPNASLSPSPKSMASYSQSPGTGGKQQTVSSTITLSELVLPSSTSSAPAMLVSTQTAESLDCDWSEHTCPDGYKYYYNCITCESKWEKPEEYSFYEQQLQKLQQRLSSSQQVFSSQEVSQMQQEPDIVQVQAVTSNMTPIIAPTCV